jgi:protein TonB
VKEFDSHLVASVGYNSKQEMSIRISAPGSAFVAPGGFAVAVPAGAIRVAGDVQQSNLVLNPAPVYPPLAKQARVTGTVRLTAVIGKDGHVTNLSVISGHPLLIPASLDAVKDWMYKPTLLNGEPVAVVTEIDINFTLSE